MRWRRGRHERVAARAERGERAWLRDRLRHPDERIRLRDEQIRELRQQVGALTAENAQLLVAVSAAVMAAGLERYRRDGRETARRLADEPTVVVRADSIRRPASETERWTR